MTNIVWYGSSTVEGTGASEPDRRFTSLASRTLGREEINLGMGGTTVTGRDPEGLIVDENSGIARVPDVLDAQPDLVIILYGANDFAAGCPLGDESRFQQGTFFWDYDTMLRGLLDGLEPAQVVLCTPQYRADAATPNGQGRTLPDYGRVIRDMGPRYRVRVLDAYADAGMDASNWASLTSDGIHLNDAGHECLAAFFIEALRAS